MRIVIVMEGSGLMNVIAHRYLPQYLPFCGDSSARHSYIARLQSMPDPRFSISDIRVLFSAPQVME